MKNWFWAILLINCCAFGQAFNYKKDYSTILARTKDKNDKLWYDGQLKRFLHNDATMTESDVLALMIGFTGTPNYKPNQNVFREKIIAQLNSEQNYADAIKVANRYLKTNPVSLKAIYGKSYALLKLQQNDSAYHYAKQWQKILRAMFYSGKGTSINDPTFSMGPEDGEEFIRLNIRGDIKSAVTEKDKDGNTFQVYDAVLDKKKLTLFFAIQHAAKLMEEDTGK